MTGIPEDQYDFVSIPIQPMFSIILAQLKKKFVILAFLYDEEEAPTGIRLLVEFRNQNLFKVVYVDEFMPTR